MLMLPQQIWYVCTIFYVHTYPASWWRYSVDRSSDRCLSWTPSITPATPSSSIWPSLTFAWRQLLRQPTLWVHIFSVLKQSIGGEEKSKIQTSIQNAISIQVISTYCVGRPTSSHDSRLQTCIYRVYVRECIAIGFVFRRRFVWRILLHRSSGILLA